MKLKKIQKLVENVIEICRKKVIEAEKKKLPEDNIAYEEGRLFEAQYILDKIEQIIYDDYND
jgi:multimeric flavodoxin WrbA